MSGPGVSPYRSSSCEQLGVKLEAAEYRISKLEDLVADLSEKPRRSKSFALLNWHAAALGLILPSLFSALPIMAYGESKVFAFLCVISTSIFIIGLGITLCISANYRPWREPVWDK